MIFIICVFKFALHFSLYDLQLLISFSLCLCVSLFIQLICLLICFSCDSDAALGYARFPDVVSHPKFGSSGCLSAANDKVWCRIRQSNSYLITIPSYICVQLFNIFVTYLNIFIYHYLTFYLFSFLLTSLLVLVFYSISSFVVLLSFSEFPSQSIGFCLDADYSEALCRNQEGVAFKGTSEAAVRRAADRNRDVLSATADALAVGAMTTCNACTKTKETVWCSRGKKR